MIEWFDDVRVGMRFKSPEKLVTREDIKRFAAEFDPQPYHLDEAVAEQSMLKGLAASGWHTAAMCMRLAVETHPFGPHPLLGIGVDELRWLAPVRPGDVIHLEGEVTEVTPSKTRPYREGEVDGLQSGRGGVVHVHPDRHRAAAARVREGVAMLRKRKERSLI